MDNRIAIHVCFGALFVAGCSNDAELEKAKADTEAAKREAKQLKAELAKAKAEVRANAQHRQRQAKPVNRKPPMPRQAKPRVKRVRFDEKDMIRPINLIDGFEIGDYRKLPNCLDVLQKCVAVPFAGKTSAQYKDAVAKIAHQPCRLVLEVVDISANYDYADFKILTDDGKPETELLKQTGNLSGYNRHIKIRFPINNAKAKGLDAKRRAVGDRVVIVGLGSIVAASPWGARSPMHGVLRGDSRYVMLRAFEKPDSFRGTSYELAFMVRNWYFAKQ